jgi:hypothetical protein
MKMAGDLPAALSYKYFYHPAMLTTAARAKGK